MINNKILLYIAGNNIQYSVVNHHGKEYEKEYIYIYITESLYCIPRANNIVNQLKRIAVSKRSKLLICQRKYAGGLSLNVPPPPPPVFSVASSIPVMIRAQISGLTTGHRIKVTAEGVCDE